MYEGSLVSERDCIVGRPEEGRPISSNGAGRERFGLRVKGGVGIGLSGGDRNGSGRLHRRVGELSIGRGRNGNRNHTKKSRNLNLPHFITLSCG